MKQLYVITLGMFYATKIFTMSEDVEHLLTRTIEGKDKGRPRSSSDSSCSTLAPAIRATLIRAENIALQTEMQKLEDRNKTLKDENKSLTQELEQCNRTITAITSAFSELNRTLTST